MQRHSPVVEHVLRQDSVREEKQRESGYLEQERRIRARKVGDTVKIHHGGGNSPINFNFFSDSRVLREFVFLRF